MKFLFTIILSTISLLFVSCQSSNSAQNDSEFKMSSAPSDNKPATKQVQINPKDTNIKLVWANSMDEMNDWRNLSSTFLDYPVNKTFSRNQVFVFGFLINEYSLNAQSQFDLTVDFAVLDPNQEAIMGARDFSVAKGYSQSMSDYIMADTVLNIRMDDSDPLGQYTVIAWVTDKVSKKEALTQFKFQLVD